MRKRGKKWRRYKGNREEVTERKKEDDTGQQFIAFGVWKLVFFF